MKNLYLVVMMLLCFGTAHAQYAWYNKNDFPDTARHGSGYFTINGKGYIVGGILDYSPSLKTTNQTWEYNPATDTWLRKADYPHKAGGGTFFSMNGKGYEIGGVDSTGLYYSDGYEFDPVANTWTAETTFPENGIGGCFQFVIDTLVYIGAGQRNTGTSKSAYSYNPVSNTWKSIAAYPGNSSMSLTSFVIDSFGYAGMGGDGAGNFFTVMHKYNPRTNSWSPIAPFPAKKRFAHMMNFVVGGKAYVGGGSTILTGNNVWYDLSDYYVYDPVANTWSTAPGLKGPGRLVASAFSFKDSAFIVGGYQHDGDFSYRFVDEFKLAETTCHNYDTVTVIDSVHISVTDTLYISITTAVSPVNVNVISVYPNPANTHLYINAGNYPTMAGYSIKILNPLGQMVYQPTVSQQLIDVDISTWPAGTYILQVINPANAVMETKKLILH